VAEAADPAVERLRGRVDGGDAAGHRGLHALEVLDQAEVGDLDVRVDQEEVLRLDVEVLELVLRVHQVERLGGLGHVAEQFLARDADLALGAALLEAVPEVLVGQLHDDHELAVDDVEAFQGQDVGVADRLDAAEGLQLLFGPLALFAEVLEVAVDELDGLEQAAGGFGLPDLAKAAAAQALEEPVAGDGLSQSFDPQRHGRILEPARGGGRGQHSSHQPVTRTAGYGLRASLLYNHSFQVRRSQTVLRVPRAKAARPSCFSP